MSKPSTDPAGAMVSAGPDAVRPRIGVGGFHISNRAKQLVMEVLDSNWLTAGPMLIRFEQEIAALHGRKLGLMCNSGTGALQIALAALKEIHHWGDGDEVLVPAVTFVATANVVLFNGLKPVFVDVEPRYYTIDPAQIESRITPRTRAIMPVHVAGLPCDLDPILAVARTHDLRIVEDSCEAMFTRYKGRTVGSFGDVACFSTYAAHVLSTGVGGLAITDDARCFEVMMSVMNHGREPMQMPFDNGTSGGVDLQRFVDSRFSFVRLGHSFRCTEMEAALGLAQLEEREATWRRRQEIADRLTAGLADLSGALQLPERRPDAEHGYMMYPLTILDPAVQRADLIRHLSDLGIETRYLLPLINQPVYRTLFGNLDADYPVATRLNESAFYVGCHPEMSDPDVEYMIRAFHSYFENRR